MIFCASAKQIRAGHGDEYPSAMEYTALTTAGIILLIRVTQQSVHFAGLASSNQCYIYCALVLISQVLTSLAPRTIGP